MPKKDKKGPSKEDLSKAGQVVGILLLPDFPLMSYASIVEPLRAANVLSDRPLYRWSHISIDGRDVRASNGVEIRVDAGVGTEIKFDILLVCAGGNPSRFNHTPTLRWLRRIARMGIPLGGVSGGSYVLARSGLLDGYRCTIHWEHLPAFVENFPDVIAERSLFVVDRKRLSCAGGISGLDMMHTLIEKQHGDELAAAVSDWFLQTHIRSGSGPQRMSARERFGVSNAALLRILEYMESHIEKPATRGQLAQLSDLSVRHIERLFSRYLGSTIRGHYLTIRLDRARQLLRQTSQPILAIAVATGFASASHFSREYRKKYGLTPTQDRTP